MYSHLATVPEVPVKYCRHPSGPPRSLSPHAYCVTLMSHDLEVDPVPSSNAALWQASAASTITGSRDYKQILQVM
jgi:hypothetical protein